MAEYRCQFIAAAASFAEGEAAVEAAETFSADTDDVAWIKAEAMLQQRGGRARGFELWQSDRLVHRHPASRIDVAVPRPLPQAANER